MSWSPKTYGKMPRGSAPASRLRCGRGRRALCLAAVLGLEGALLPLAAHAQADYRARYRQVIEPQPVRLRFREADFGMMAEGSHQETLFRKTGERVEYDHFFLGPQLGLAVDGSIYHPNFIQFSLAGDGAYGRDELKTKSPAATQRNTQWQTYGRFVGSASILAGKPLSGGLSASYGRSYREYDFFTHSTIDSRGYGAHLGYREADYSVGTSYSYSDEQLLDSDTPYSSRQELATLNAQKERRAGATSFNYAINRYTVSEVGEGAEALDQTVSLSDSERFGSREQSYLQSNLSYAHRDSEAELSDQWSLNGNLTAEHSPTLSSYYDAGYDRLQTEDYVAQSAAGNAGVRHRLYQSLNSTLGVRGAYSSSSSDGSDGLARRYGTVWGENYTKRLGSSHRLRIDHSLNFDRVEQKNASRAIKERHTFPSPPAVESFPLNLSQVVESSIVVRDSNGIRSYVRGIDFEVFPYGSRVEIRRIPGGTIPEGGTVLVDYDAEPGGQGDYDMISDWVGVRFDLWGDLWSLYARMNISRNNALSTLHVDELSTYIFGTEVNKNWLRASADYEIYDSDDTSFRMLRFTEGCSFRPDPASSLGLRFTQSFIDRTRPDRREADYRFTSHFNRMLTRHMQGSLDAGFDVRRGEGVDQTLLVFRPEIKWRVGLTSINVRYDYEWNEYLQNERRNRHDIMFSLRRKF